MTTAERDRWNERYRAAVAGPTLPHPALARLRCHLPAEGRLLDAGGGTGRNSIWAAGQGFDVTLADISEVGLAVAERNAESAGVHLQRWCTDLDTTQPVRRWEVVLCANFLQPRLLRELDRWLTAKGTFVMLHPTTENLRRHAKPSRRYLVKPEEVLARLPSCDLLHFDSAWRDDGRHEMELVCRLSN